VRPFRDSLLIVTRVRVVASVVAALVVAACSGGGHTVQSPVEKASAAARGACTELQPKVAANPSELAQSVRGPNDQPVMNAVTFATDSAQQAADLDATWKAFLAALQDLFRNLTYRADGGPDEVALTPDLTAISATCSQLGQPLSPHGAAPLT